MPADAAYTPDQIRSAYGVNDLTLDGTGQTIAIVDAYENPAIYQALDAFDAQFGATVSGPTLYAQYGPASSFLSVVNQSGQAAPLPEVDPIGPGNSNWELESELDIEWAHAMAPGARIVLVEANSQSLADLMASVAIAASQPGVSVVSMSWGFPEGQSVLAQDEATYDSYFTAPGVTFVASSGDYGTADPEYPAFSPNVVAVGGTTLSLNRDGSYQGETGWGYTTPGGEFIGSGGGVSQFESEPAYQQGVQSTGSRTAPDVAFVGDPATGGWVADPYNLGSSQPFEVVGGTSLGAPSWAGLVALVNQGRADAGQPVLNSASPTETQQALYSLGQSDYHVIASGTNGGYNAAPGYNLVTGLGTPMANLLVPDMVAGNYPATGRVAAISSDLNANPGWSGSGGGTFNVMAVRGQGSGVRGQGTEVGGQRSGFGGQGSGVGELAIRGSDGEDFAAFGSGTALVGTPLAVRLVVAGPEDALPEFRASDGAAEPVESANDLELADYYWQAMGQDSGSDPWLGAYERAGDAFDSYREAFQAVLDEWPGP
jgi:subtilase family serine protease